MRKRLATAGLAGLVLAASSLVLGAAPAHAATPVLVNAAGTQWLESLAVPKDTNGERIWVTAIVKHDLGTSVTGLALDDDWNGTDNTATLAPDGVTVTALPGGPSNYSAVRYSFVPPNMSFSCGLFSGTRRTNSTLRMRAVLSDGQRTGVVSANVHSVENGQCLGATDFPYLFNQSQTATEVTPGSSVTFTFQGDDVDGTGGNDRLDKMRWRVRRLNDGAITQGPTNVGGLNDNTNINLAVTFPQRGRYVVEAELGGEDDAFGSFENGGQFFRIGAVDVNTAASSSPTVTLSPSPAVVNDGASATVTATASDSDFGGRVQMIQWDADNNGTFERRELADDETTGLSAAEVSQSVTTTAGNCADRTVNAAVTDNGAMNGADSVRRVDTASATLVVNCAPTAAGQSVSTAEDTAKSITLGASDPDGDALTYTVVTAPAHGSVTGGTGAARTYTPASNYNGGDSFTFRVTDVHGRQSGTATVLITVTAVNDAPVAADVARATDEDTPVVIDLSGAVSDVDGDTLAVSVSTGPVNGNAVATGPREVTYGPDGNFNGVDSFVYTVGDGNGGTDTGVVTVTVDPVDDAPVAADQTVSTPEEIAVTVTLGPTADDDGEAVTYTVATAPDDGSVVVVGNQATYTPGLNFNGTDQFVFAASDGNSAPMGTVTIIVTPVNDAPVADDQSVATPEDTATTITLTASDVDADSLTFTVTSGPLHGTLDTTAGPAIVYTPAANYFGPDSITFLVDDGNGGTDTATVSIDVTPVNDPPVADDQSVATGEDTPVGVLLTASDVEGDPLAFTVVSGPVHGTLTGTAPNVVYTPGLNYNGPDSFTFVVSDGTDADTGTVELSVAPVNDAPAAIPQALATAEDTPLGIVLAATDVDGDPLTFAVVSGPSHGSLSGTAPVLTYTPDADFNGTDGFVFVVTDPDGLTDTATVIVVVGDGGTNDAPVAVDQAVTTDEDLGALVVLVATDVDGDALAFTVDVAPAHGTLSGVAPNLVYTPAVNFHGSDSFVFRVDDGHGGLDFGTVSLTVTSLNDAPDAIPQVVSVLEDTTTGVTLSGVDVDGDGLTFALTSAPAHGTLSGTAPNLVYTPAADYNGPDAFTFSVSDGHGGSDGATVTLDVRPAPMLATHLEANAAFVTILPGLRVRFSVMSATLTVASTGQPVGGALVQFTTGQNFPLCHGYTDASGFVACGNLTGSVNLILGLGYNAYYGGNADLLPTSDNGPLLVVGGIGLP